MKKLFLIFICLSAMRSGILAGNKTPKIAIIGGGIGGTSCAFFLKSLFADSDVCIDVFEAEKIGGRLSVVEFSEKPFEEGGSIIHSSNKYMVDFLNKFGLRKRQSAGGYFGLYDGEEFVFSESEWEVVTLWNAVHRYGLGFWKLRSYIDDMLKKFGRIYELQDSGVTFTTVGSMLAAMDPKFADYLHMTTKFGFESQGISKIVVDEIIMATIRANYGQDLTVQKMVGSVSVAGAIGSLWSVHGGNFQIPQHLFNASSANLIGRPVTAVRRTPSGRLQVQTEPTPDDVEEPEDGLYDVVIVAAPQTSDAKYKIHFEDFHEEIRFPGRYHKTVCTLVEGTLSPNYFSSKNPVVDEIITTKTDVPFNSIGRITPVDYTPKKYNRSNVWKVFTQSAMPDNLLYQLFSEVRSTHVREWLAYPHYDHSFRNDSFVVAPNVYHINAVEWAASAMEMSVIGARNVALLSYKQLTASREEQFSGPRHGTSPRTEL